MIEKSVVRCPAPNRCLASGCQWGKFTPGLSSELDMLRPKFNRLLCFGTISLLLIGAGCVVNEPTRVPVDALVDDNGGLQAKDVQSATDRFANALLALPRINSSDHKVAIVVIDPVDQTTYPYGAQYNVFSNRLKSVISQKSDGRVQLISNKAVYSNLQAQELDGPPGAVHPAGVQPEYALTLTINEMPNRATSYYQVNASLSGLNDRVMLWNDTYEIQAER